ncbi:LOW QUALITY PROTEIN: hypothetical protein V1477_018482 [Vespula maculifrons]|uniref:Uncharacterized protein n=1 Tax=Vespula maculifrons TaxID=7453 RepID=A0ABD2AVH2_VESMC
MSLYLARTGEKKSFYTTKKDSLNALPRWSLGDATIAAPGKKRTNEDSTLTSTNRDASPLRELRASQQTGDYYRPGSHRLEVAAAGDPRTNGDSTLKSTIRDASPLRELRASQQTGDTQFQCIASTTDPGPTAWRLLHLGTHGLTSISIGLLFAPENTTSLPADTGVRVLPILPIYGTLADMSKSMNWRRSRREREEKKAGTCAHVKGIVSGRKRRRHIGNVTRARVRTMKWKRKGGHRVKDFGKILNNAAIRKVIIAAYKISTYHKKQSNGAIPLPTNSTLKLQLHAYSHLGTDLLIAQLSNIESFDHHLSTTAQTPESKIESTAVTILTRAVQKHSREYVEYVGSNFGHNRAREHPTPMPVDISECPCILPEREKRNPSTPQKDSLNALPRWSLGDATIAAPGKKRTNEDSTLTSTNRDASPLRELRASQQTGDV